MDKKTAQQTLEQLQKSIADAQRQAKELQAIIDKPDVPMVYQGRLVNGTSESTVSIFFLDSETDVRDTLLTKPSKVSPNGKRLAAGLAFASREAAGNYLDYLEVRQKARVAMANAWGNDKPTWAPSTPVKYCITFSGELGRCKVEQFTYSYQPIHFPTRETAADFLASLSLKEAELLIKGM